MLKHKLTAEEFGKLPAAIQAEYKEAGGNYTLDLDVVIEDVTGLKNSLEQERAKRKEVVAQKQVLEGQIVDLQARAGSVTDVEKAWTAKVEAVKKEKEDGHKKLTGEIERILVDTAAEKLAKEISTAPTLMLPFIKSRLRVEADDEGKFATKVILADGKPSALTLEELGAEFRGNKDFAAVISAGNGSGGGAGGHRGGGAGGTKALKDMNESERTALYKADPAQFKILSAGQ